MVFNVNLIAFELIGFKVSCCVVVFLKNNLFSFF